jgi:hypothetical protein
MSLTLYPDHLLGQAELEAGESPIPGATWYRVQAVGDGLEYRFPAGTLNKGLHLSADLLLDGRYLVTFLLRLHEGEKGPAFMLTFGLLNQCQARLRLALTATDLNRWLYGREAAWLKPLCGGDLVDLARVDRMTITVLRKSEEPDRFCMTAVTASEEESPPLTDPILPHGPLIDRLGQSTLHEWPAKSRSVEEVTARLQRQLAEAPAQAWPRHFSRWGGWLDRSFEGTGYFRTHHDGRRWWLVDPDGYAFWSAGLDCVRVDAGAAYRGLETAFEWLPEREGPYAAAFEQEIEILRQHPLVSFLGVNFIRAFGTDTWRARWATIALAELRRLGFNTVGNWSRWEIARAAAFPYVRPLDFEPAHTPMIFRDFPDVFHPGFAQDAAEYAGQLRATADDPALIGYFLMNEPTWAFARQMPAEGMLFTTTGGPARAALAAFLRERYGDDAALSKAWGIATTLDAIAAGEWRAPLNEAAMADLAAFSEVLVVRLFRGLTDACRAVDPHHLNLGVRYYTVPPAWALEGMRSFDVYSMNCYRPRVPAADLERISTLLDRPTMIGEYHFGALDVGLPASGIGRAPDQVGRGKAYRVYTEDAAAQPSCVGTHYFILYDQSALGRFDGENYNIGFVDICNRPYDAPCSAARATHERIYEVAAGQVEPYADAPEYLPLLCV